MLNKWLKRAALALAPVFAVAAMRGCDTAEEWQAEVQRHMTASEAACPARTGEPFEAARLRTALESAYRVKHIRQLADTNVTVCMSRALADAKTVAPYNYPVFGVYYPPEEGKGAFLYLWDDGKPSRPLRLIMNEDSYTRHPAQVFRGVSEIMDGKKFGLKPGQINIALGNGGCGYNCVDVNWYAQDKQAEFIALNPGLFPRQEVSEPSPAPAVE